MSSTGLRFRTPADVRAIPNEQMELWLRDDDLPWMTFAAEANCQRSLRTIVNATRRRMAAR